MPTTLSIPVPGDFSLPHAVCSYGYFILAPNRWDAATATLHRPLRDTAGRAIAARIRQVGRSLRVTCNRTVGRGHHDHLRRQVARMLRIDEDLAGWRRVHPKAARRRFGRLFRSPTLFEDVVKTITSCNVAWPSTVKMNQMLCEHAGSRTSGGGDFPTAAELAAWKPARLKKLCRVGYRAERIIKLARDVDAGRIDLAWYENPTRSTDELFESLVAIYGIGPYAAANVLQCIGRFDRLPVDTETVRHFAHTHNVHGDLAQITRKAHRFYDGYAPYQFLAYWYELWGDYESRVGPAQQWGEEVHTQFTASKLK